MTSSMGGYRGPTGKFSQAASTGQIKEKIPSGYRVGQIQQYTPEQLQLYQHLFPYLGPESHLSRLAGGDEETFRQVEAPALRQFSELQGDLASRFSGLGGLGARKSSGFQNASTAAASNFAQELQLQRQGLQRQAILDLMGLSGDLLGQRPFQRSLVPKQESGGGFGGVLGAGLGAVGGFLSGGPPGALTGAQLGYNVGSSF